MNLSVEEESRLDELGYIVGSLRRVMFLQAGVKETNWSVTGLVRGVDGINRRWVYLHYFKSGQPSINWLDPTFAGMKLVVGDALHSLRKLGSKGLRLDANGFLGIERNGTGIPAWSEGHPVSLMANQIIASMVRKVGGFTYQELNLSIDDIKQTSTYGADLSYDFVTRPAYHHALATGDTEFLALMMQEALNVGLDSASLIHALQNHDEVTTELVHLWSIHKDDVYEFRGSNIKGLQLRDVIRTEIHDALAGEHAPYNALFTDNGVACTTVSAILASQGIRDPYHISDEQKTRALEAHLLLAAFNAMQPGVFAVSGWDLVGALPLEKEQVKELLYDGDTRWIIRGAYDLAGVSDEEDASALLPQAVCLYGSLLDQLQDKESFALRLRHILQARKKYRIAEGTLLEVIRTNSPSVLALLIQLPDDGGTNLLALNFSGSEVTGVEIRTSAVRAGAKPQIIVSSGVSLESGVEGGVMLINLQGYGFVSLILQ